MENQLYLENQIQKMPLSDLAFRYSDLLTGGYTNINDIYAYQNTPMTVADYLNNTYTRYPGLGAMEALNQYVESPDVVNINGCAISSAGFLGIDPKKLMLIGRNRVFVQLRKSGGSEAQGNSRKESGFNLPENEKLKRLGLGNKFLGLYQVIVEDPDPVKYSHAVAAIRYPHEEGRNGNIYPSNDWMYWDTRNKECPLIPSISTECLLEIIGSDFLPQYKRDLPPVQFVSFPYSI